MRWHWPPSSTHALSYERRTLPPFPKLDNDRTFLYIQTPCRTSAFPRAVVRINQTRNNTASNGELTNWKHAPTVFAVFDCHGQSFAIVGLLDRQIERQHVVRFYFY